MVEALGHSRPHAATLAGLGAAILLHVTLGAVAVQRAGFTADEEITSAVVAGISASGSPLLPSGVLYHRGVPHSYLVWAAGELFGHQLTTYRGVSLAASALGLVAAFSAAARVGGSHACGLVAALILAVFPPYLAAASFARPYAVLVATALAALALFARWRDTRSRPSVFLFLVAVTLASALHPVGTLLVAVPMLAALLERTPKQLALLSIGAAAAAQAPYLAHLYAVAASDTTVSADVALYAVPDRMPLPVTALAAVIDPASIAATAAVFVVLMLAAIRSVPGRERWLVVACAVLAAACQLGLLAVLVAFAWLIAPRGGVFRLAVAACFAAASTLWWACVMAWKTDGLFTLALFPAVWRIGIEFPLGGLRYTLENIPHLALLALAAAATVRGHESVMPRVVALLTGVVLIGFSAAGIPLVERYLLLPWVLVALLAACGIVRAGAVFARGGGSAPSIGRRLGYAAAMTTTIAVGHAFYGAVQRVESEGASLLAPRTGASWSAAGVRPYVRPSDVVVCTEELACLHLVGRLDYSLMLTDVDRRHYAVRRGGRLQGFYAGSPVIESPDELARVVHAAAGRCVVVVSLNSRKIDFDVPRRESRLLIERGCGTAAVDTDELFVGRLCGGSSPQCGHFPAADVS